MRPRDLGILAATGYAAGWVLSTQAMRMMLARKYRGMSLVPPRRQR